MVAAVTQIDDYGKLADTIASHLAVKLADKQAILEIHSIAKRFEKCLALMESEISVLQVEKRIRTRVKRQMEKTQREYYLNEQMKAIQKELGDEDGKDEMSELENRIKATKLTKEARDKALAELKKLRQMSPMSAEATVVRNYLDWLLSIPWQKKSKIKKDLPAAQALLDADHFGLDKVKDRIVEYLAVQQRANKLTGPILCLVGPPGVGKTSLGKSIAKATGREFVRMSLGGVRDEAEIRGHRRTYIGSMPGKVIQSMRKAKSSNPLFLLDEIDKMGMDFRGDPSSALLEVLDPEQNATFNDHYLEVDYDLSSVMFVTTANTLNIPPALMDRMEIIRIAGYTEDEKLEIAKRHLLPNSMAKHGLDAKEFEVDDSALLELVRRYTREAGVRNLEREISNLSRKAVKEILTNKKKRIVVTAENVADFLGVPKYPLRRDRGGRSGRPGDGSRLDGGRRRVADDRRRHDARQGPHDGDRQSEGRDEGIDFGGGVLRPLARRRFRHRAAAVRQARRPRSRARRRDAEGRPVGGRRDGDRHRLDDDRHSGQARHRDDRRDHAARPRAADRRPEGEAAGGAARRHQEGADPRGQRQGPRGHPDLGQERPRDRAGLADGGSARARARAPAQADRLGGGPARRRPRRSRATTTPLAWSLTRSAFAAHFGLRGREFARTRGLFSIAVLELPEFLDFFALAPGRALRSRWILASNDSPKALICRHAGQGRRSGDQGEQSGGAKTRRERQRRGQMNKLELVEHVAKEADLTKVSAATALEAVLDGIAKSLKKGDEVRLVGFGTFSVRERAAGKGRNPATGKEIKIAASKNARFKAGAALKASLNTKKAAKK